MNRLACLLALLLPAAAVAADPPKPTVVAKDIKNLLEVCVSPDGRTFVATNTGVSEVKDGKATKLLDVEFPSGLVAFQQSLFVAASGGSVHRINLGTGKTEVWAEKKDFPSEPAGLHGITVDERGVVYVAEVGQQKTNALYAIGVKFAPPGRPPARGEIKKVADLPTRDVASGHSLASDGMNHVLVMCNTGEFVRVNVNDGKAEPVGSDLSAGGLDVQYDQNGRLWFFDKQAIWAVPRPGVKPVKVADMPESWGGFAYHPMTKQLLYADQKKESLLAIPAQIPGWEVDESPLPVELTPAFDAIKWTGWDDGSASGKSNPLRPLVLTHANDGSGRTFVATQHGVIHSIDKGAKETKVFLDIQDRVLYRDNENEQGLLGLAFHPKFKTNGEFYVFYTDKSKKLENVLCRFKVKKDDPTQADPASEEELLRVSHKFWNHDGGTVAFGPDGFLYLVLGDGGAFNDPDDHGQQTDTLLAKILRLDVDNKGEKTAYAIPKDNPFVGNAKYRPEIFALGVRNPWRLSFDRKTGQGWFGDVGQNLFEEVNLLEKGANYGWRRREGLHPFWSDGSGPDKKYTDPIWEYSHDVGKSITAGPVYRGKAVPALDGHFLYADYVSGKVWGLKYDEKAKKVTANRPIAAKPLAWMSFGEDEAGEAYLMTYSATGKGIYTFKASEKK